MCKDDKQTLLDGILKITTKVVEPFLLNYGHGLCTDLTKIFKMTKGLESVDKGDSKMVQMVIWMSIADIAMKQIVKIKGHDVSDVTIN
jgi:hypothetical protein